MEPDCKAHARRSGLIDQDGIVPHFPALGGQRGRQTPRVLGNVDKIKRHRRSLFSHAGQPGVKILICPSVA
jgi:hypothetical protein